MPIVPIRDRIGAAERARRHFGRVAVTVGAGRRSATQKGRAAARHKARHVTLTAGPPRRRRRAVKLAAELLLALAR